MFHQEITCFCKHFDFIQFREEHKFIRAGLYLCISCGAKSFPNPQIIAVDRMLRHETIDMNWMCLIVCFSCGLRFTYINLAILRITFHSYLQPRDLKKCQKQIMETCIVLRTNHSGTRCK